MNPFNENPFGYDVAAFNSAFGISNSVSISKKGVATSTTFKIASKVSVGIKFSIDGDDITYSFFITVNERENVDLKVTFTFKVKTMFAVVVIAVIVFILVGWEAVVAAGGVAGIKGALAGLSALFLPFFEKAW